MCCDAAQLRMHQLEAARAKEMHTHGELVSRLERDVESRRIHHQDMQAALAKLSSDHVRLDAEHQALRHALTLEREQHETAKLGIVRLRDELASSRAQTDKDLEHVREQLEQMQRNDNDQRVHQAVLHAQLDALRVEHQHVAAARESALSACSERSLECARLTDALTAKQHDADMLSLRAQLLTDELTQSRAHTAAAQQRADDFEKSRDAALRTRNRTLTWRKQRSDIATARTFHLTVLLAWRTFALHSRDRAVRDRDAQVSADAARLSARKRQLRGELESAQAFLQTLRTDVRAFPLQLARFRDDVCRIELPQLVTQLATSHERCTMAIADTEAKQLITLEAAAQTLTKHRTAFRSRQIATLALLRNARRLGTRRQAFDGWKDMYLRNMVAQTTHAAMLAQQQVTALVAGAQYAEATRSLPPPPPVAATRASRRGPNVPQARQIPPPLFPPQLHEPPRLFFSARSLAQHCALVKQARATTIDSAIADAANAARSETQTRLQQQRSSDHRLLLTATTERDWERWRRVQPSSINDRSTDLAVAAVAAVVPLSPTTALLSPSRVAKLTRKHSRSS